MLEEVEMTPAELREIMSLTGRTARRVRVALTSSGLDLKTKVAWLLCKVQRLAHNSQGSCEAKTQRQ